MLKVVGMLGLPVCYRLLECWGAVMDVNKDSMFEIFADELTLAIKCYVLLGK